MSIVQKNLWRVTCDKCGKEATIETFMDFSPTGQDLIDHGFVRVLDVMPISYGQHVQNHYCTQCAQAMMDDEG